ncbi:hypothetical protein R80B4_02085 [Fibrobacteres bacterium R8-0-B4]
MQTMLLGTYSNGVIELDEPIEDADGNRVAVVFLDKSKAKKKMAINMSIDKMCGVFAGKISVSASDDFADNKRKEMETEV